MTGGGDPILQLRPDVAEWAAEGGEAVLLDLASATYAAINRAGTVLLTALARGATRAELVALLVDDFGITQERAATDVASFVAACRDRRLLQP